MFTLRKKTQQQEIHFSHFILQLAMHAARGCHPLQLMSAHRVEICRVLYRAYFTNTLYILPSAYIAICTPWLSHPHILHTPSTLKICIYAASVDEIRKYAQIVCTSFLTLFGIAVKIMLHRAQMLKGLNLVSFLQLSPCDTCHCVPETFS